MILSVNYDNETGDTYITIPDHMMEEMGWQLGDDLKYEIDPNRFVTIINVSKEKRDNGKV
jgi:antitoxin component of MazEF toxin-antitoxin module